MRWIQTLLVIVVLGAGGLARADEFYDTYQAGMKLFTEKSYPAARAEFQKAYDMRPEPLVLFNIAQTYRLEGNAKEALVYYKRYLTEAKTTDDVRRDAQDYIIQLEEKPKPPTDGPKNPDGTPVRVGEPPMTRPMPPRDEPHEQPRHRTIPLGSKIAAGVTGAALIYALITTKTGLAAESDFKELRAAGNATQKDADVVARDQKLINIGWGVTGAAALTTVVIYFVAPSYASPARSAAIVPSRGGGMLAFSRSF